MQKTDAIQFLTSCAILMVVVVLSSFVFTKFDLTEEKRHTLTSASIDMLSSLDDQVYIKCYLHGEYPARFQRFERAIKERLDEFVDYSDGMVSYEFIDPYSIDDAKTITEVETALYEQGLSFTRLSYEENGTTKYQLVWPGAIITYKNKDYPVQLYKSPNPEATELMVNSSIERIEYELASRILYLIQDEVPRIGILEGHGELDEWNLIDLTFALQENYFVERVKIDEKIFALSDKAENSEDRINKFDLLIIAKPDSLFSNKDKLVIDQFIMNGGRTLWMIDPILTDLDSLAKQQQTYGITNEMGLYDMLYSYGVRPNRNMVIDYNCAPIVFDVGPQGNQRNVDVKRWYYAPLAIPRDSAHIITNHLDPIHFEFASSLDFVGENTKVRKTPLLRSSTLSRELPAPVRVNTGIVNLELPYFEPRAGEDRLPPFNLAVLLEGEFESNFTNRLPDTIKNDPNIAFRGFSKPNAMVIIADGDICRNKIMDGRDGPLPVPLGYDRYSGRVVYDNKEFLHNSVNYLMGDKALIQMRSRNIIIRKLNEEKIIKQRTRFQIVNVAFPLFLVVVFGLIQGYFRSKKFSQNNILSK
jgi:ABC-2 type transport system permease protein